MEKLQKAIEFATNAHKGQKRKYTGEDYIVHPIAVMEILRGFNFHEEILCAAVLHDTVEDTPVTLQDIEENFGTIVAKLVEDLTDVFTKEAFPQINRKYRKQLECYRILKISGHAKSIKVADLIDNTKSIVEHDEAFSGVYLKEKQELLFVLDGAHQGLMDIAVRQMFKLKK